MSIREEKSCIYAKKVLEQSIEKVKKAVEAFDHSSIREVNSYDDVDHLNDKFDDLVHEIEMARVDIWNMSADVESGNPEGYTYEDQQKDFQDELTEEELSEIDKEMKEIFGCNNDHV